MGVGPIMTSLSWKRAIKNWLARYINRIL